MKTLTVNVMVKEKSVPCVYLLTNTEVPYIIKVGMTTKNPWDRANQQNGHSNVIGTWIVHDFWRSDTPSIDESIAHKSLSLYSIMGKKEQFKTTPETAIPLIEAALSRAADTRTEAEEELVERNRLLEIVKKMEIADAARPKPKGFGTRFLGRFGFNPIPSDVKARARQSFRHSQNWPNEENHWYAPGDEKLWERMNLTS